ncbi:NADPH:quinone oxidoreductase [Hyella patelloides LEGE 07179]|uniref:NADPH:quinone oxidoreductase n=1 Tax=Hyella patelloides LEGE 07179 TaxID=945734 RepID=A0A563VQF3_9CYAN|nr:zinc-dependent alcohol dehydrogenase family protein [Hyella patelloides]VEP13624.1 NADPH:quinone oxidoreductase [Hyella patelloides LEGE 07179]
MSLMKAALLTEFGSANQLEIQEVPKPQPKHDQILVRVCATSINPIDYQIRRGDYQDLVKLPVIIGVDISGVVEAVGESVTSFQIGDEVYYSPQLLGESGSYAEYHVASEHIVARKPSKISHIEAACFPLAAGTAWDCLVTRGKLQVGESILIHGGAGGVGSFAIQLAKAMGAYVFTTCSAKNHDLVKKLGADRIIDYQKEDYVAAIEYETQGKGIDLVLDTIGGETIQKSLEIIRPYGRLVSIVDIDNPQSLLTAWAKNLTLHFVFTSQENTKLNSLRQLIERKQLFPIIERVMPLIQVAEAHQRLEQGGTRGKIVLQVFDD